MALATAAALWWTLRQTHVLAQPHQQNDLWYVSSVHNELARVSLLARNLTNVRTFSYGNDTPLFAGSFQVLVDRPRTIALRSSFKF